MTGTNLPKNKQKKIELIEKGEQTYLTVSDISDLLLIISLTKIKLTKSQK